MSEELNNQKQFSEMTTAEFIEDVLDFALTKEQKLLLTMFKELKSKKEDKLQQQGKPMPLDNDTINSVLYRNNLQGIKTDIVSKKYI